MLSEFQVMCTVNQLYFAVILISQRRSDFRNLNAFQIFSHLHVTSSPCAHALRLATDVCMHVHCTTLYMAGVSV